MRIEASSTCYCCCCCCCCNVCCCFCTASYMTNHISYSNAQRGECELKGGQKQTKESKRGHYYIWYNEHRRICAGERERERESTSDCMRLAKVMCARTKSDSFRRYVCLLSLFHTYSSDTKSIKCFSIACHLISSNMLCHCVSFCCLQ